MSTTYFRFSPFAAAARRGAQAGKFASRRVMQIGKSPKCAVVGRRDGRERRRRRKLSLAKLVSKLRRGRLAAPLAYPSQELQANLALESVRKKERFFRSSEQVKIKAVEREM